MHFVYQRCAARQHLVSECQVAILMQRVCKELLRLHKSMAMEPSLLPTVRVWRFQESALKIWMRSTKRFSLLLTMYRPIRKRETLDMRHQEQEMSLPAQGSVSAHLEIMIQLSLQGRWRSKFSQITCTLRLPLQVAQMTVPRFA